MLEGLASFRRGIAGVRSVDRQVRSKVRGERFGLQLEGPSARVDVDGNAPAMQRDSMISADDVDHRALRSRQEPDPRQVPCGGVDSAIHVQNRANDLVGAHLVLPGRTSTGDERAVFGSRTCPLCMCPAEHEGRRRRGVLGTRRAEA